MFEVVRSDPNSLARAAVLQTAHGSIATPVFMPVGTNATVKSLTSEAIVSTGAQVILSNAYHLYLRPGIEMIQSFGGLHKFMGWNKPILTDSGGFQIFSLDKLREVRSEGLSFKSHIDGSKHFLTPESVVLNQFKLGVDIMMPLDECVAYPCSEDEAQRALDLTYKWLCRSKQEWLTLKKPGHLFGIVQGGTWPKLRQKGAEMLKDLDLPGYSIGGLSVGEPQEVMMKTLEQTTPFLPKEKPRYLMGVGYPDDIVLAVERGVDMFDCVVPTRNGRNGAFFTSKGRFQIRNAAHAHDKGPLMEGCACYACRDLSRGYIRHLFLAKEMLGPQLLSLHNLTFYIQLLSSIRSSLLEGQFQSFKKEFITHYGTTTNE